MSKTFYVLTINPGSTSTKASAYKDDVEVWRANVVHDPAELDKYDDIFQQGPYRRDAVFSAMQEAGLDPQNLDAVVAVGGAEDFQEVAHVGGFKETPRRCQVHMLNTKEVALRHAASQGKRYEDMNLVIANIGAGITIAAHRKGKVVDGTNGVDQEGPMSSNRPGTVRLASFMRLIAGKTPAEQKKLVSSQGGLVSHLGTADVLAVKDMIAAGDEYAKLVYDALLYQCGGWIGHMAAVLKGDIDGIILTGNLMK